MVECVFLFQKHSYLDCDEYKKKKKTKEYKVTTQTTHPLNDSTIYSFIHK